MCVCVCVFVCVCCVVFIRTTESAFCGHILRFELKFSGCVWGFCDLQKQERTECGNLQLRCCGPDVKMATCAEPHRSREGGRAAYLALTADDGRTAAAKRRLGSVLRRVRFALMLLHTGCVVNFFQSLKSINSASQWMT